MNFILMSCPYCSRTVDSSEPSRYVCLSCGKFIYTDRSNKHAFIRSSEIEDRIKDILDGMDEDSAKKSLEIADDLVEATESADPDSLFLRGYVYAEIGEDGKALTDWRKGLEIVSNNVNLDAYLCLMSKAVADMILFKEREFIEFNVASYIDKLCDDINAFTGMSCKAFFYYSVYINSIENSRGTEDGEVTEYEDVMPLLFKRVVAYHRNYWCLPRIIHEYLGYVDYSAKTYDDDDNEIPHIYDLIRRYLAKRISGMTEEDRLRIFDRWNDKSLKDEIEPMLDSLLKQRSNIIGGFLKKNENEDDNQPEEIHTYVDKCLLIAPDQDKASETIEPEQ